MTNTMFNAYFFIAVIFITFLIRYILIKKSFLLDNYSFSDHKNIKGQKKTILGPPLCGGLIIFLIFFFEPSFYYLNIFVFFLLIIGILSDNNILNSPKIRILLQLAAVLSFVLFFDIKVTDLRISYANMLFQKSYISIIFTAFCILILINGTNFIDGLNTLVLGYYAMVIVSIILLASKFNLLLNQNEILFLIVLVVLYFFNFLEKIFLGDSGSYIVALIASFFLLHFVNNNSSVSPYFICLLLWYPAFENFFSIVRRSVERKKNYQADQGHMHQLLFFYLLKKYKLKPSVANTLGASMINSFNLIIFVISFNYYNFTSILILLLVFSITAYLALYFFLKIFVKN
jgi:UDP-N-acetylmuramyl pentapeptide phosphotransferase/UDP-N-acetylglucosamine-1-phosphate transferase